MERLNEIATRKAELKALLEGEEKVDLEVIQKELDELEMEERQINEQIKADDEKAKNEAEARKQTAQQINDGEIKANEIELKGKEIKMEEIRNTKEYIEAFARYIKTNDDKEVRSLLTENVSGGTIAVPDFVYDVIKTNWEKDGIFALIKKLEVKGNLKVNFEISSTGATKHLEGSQAVSEEELVEGIATLVPASFKKWIKLSDEVLDMRGEAFLQYVYNEIAHHIAKEVVKDLLTQIKALGTSATSEKPKAPAITMGIAQDTIATAIGNLSDEAENPVVVMNKQTWALFKKAQYDGNFSTDIFEGLKVYFNNSLPAYNSADANDVYMIVGDFDFGSLATFPNGIYNITFKYDDKTEMTSDMVRILGREYVGIAPVACDAFVNVKKPSASV